MKALGKVVAAKFLGLSAMGMLFSANAFAGGMAQYPMISFGDVAVSVDAVCVDGDYLKPVVGEIETVADWEYETGITTETSVNAYTTPIVYSEMVCVEYENAAGLGEGGMGKCVDYDVETRAHQLSYVDEIPVVKEVGGEGGMMKVVDYISYDIPDCE